MKPAIDYGLARLCAMRAPGESFSAQEIADACGVTKHAIARIERKAIQRVGRLLAERLRMSRDDLRREIFKG